MATETIDKNLERHCNNIISQAKNIQRLGHSLWELGSSSTDLIVKFKNIEEKMLRPITGNLYPFMNMSVDEAGVIFLGNKKPVFANGKAFAIGNIADELTFVVGAEKKLTIENALVAIQTYSFTSSTLKMLSYINSLIGEASLCVTQSVLQPSATFSTSESYSIIILIELVCYASSQIISITTLLDLFKSAKNEGLVSAQSEVRKFAKTTNLLTDAYINAKTMMADYALPFNLALHTSLINGVPQFEDDKKQSFLSSFKPKGACALANFLDTYIYTSTVEVMNTWYQDDPYESWGLADYTLGMSEHPSEITKQYKLKFQKQTRMELFSRLEARDEIVYSTTPKKMLENTKLAEFITPRDVLKVEDKKLLTSSISDFMKKDPEYTSYQYLVYKSKSTRKRQLLTLAPFFTLVNIFRLLKKTGMLLANTL